MKLGTLYDYVLFMSNKDEKSGDIPPEDFNTILNAVNIELFEHQWNILMSSVKMSGMSVESLMYNNNPLNKFIKVTTKELSSKFIERMSDFEKLIKVTKVTPTITDVEEVNEVELSRRRAGITTKPISLYPVCILREDGIYIYPSNQVKPLKSYDVVYVRMPLTPFLDYCIKENDEMAYLDPTWKIIPDDAGLLDIKNENDLILYHNVTYPNYVSGVTTPLSIDIEWTESAMNLFINRVFEKIGIPLSQVDMEQYSQVEQQKGE